MSNGSGHPILSPAESLGLSGAALDSRVMNAARHVTDSTFVRIAERLHADALANELVYEHAGARDAIRVMLRPLLAHRDQLTYVHHVCLRLNEALRRLPSLYLEQPDIRRIVALDPEEERWLRDIWTADHGRNNTVYGRLDAVCDFTSASWRDTLKFMEPNLSGVGGIHYAPIAQQLVMRDVVPTLLAHDPELVVELPQDQRDLFIQLMIDHARSLGRGSCQLCLIEPRFEHDGPDEQSSLGRYFSERHGLTITHADPRELAIRDGEVLCGDVRVDVAYRDYEIRDFIALERELGRPLDAIRLLFRENRMVSSLVGDFDHKSGFEIFTEPRLVERLFTPDDCRLFQRHVLWTRVLVDRRATLPTNTTGDLLEYVRSHREQLVLKPNRSYGGEGVTLGATVSAREWENLVDEAAAKGCDPVRSWVVQEATELPVVEFPVVGAGARVHGEPFYAVMGFASTDDGLGVLCRVSQKQVVNVAQHGGMAAVLVAETPKDLRIPKWPLKSAQGTREAFRDHIVELRHLDQMIALLEWDEETNLPPNGRLQRGEQVATLEGLRHALLSSNHLGDLIEETAIQSERDFDLCRELLLLRRERKRAIAVPEDVVRHLANAKSQALAGWEEARSKNDFGSFALPFSQLLALVRERAECLASGREPYDALLDEHEPGMCRSRLDPLLSELSERLVPLVQSAMQSTAREPGVFEKRFYGAAGQWGLSRRVLRWIGFDFTRGRLDASTHPFTMLAGGDDVRLTSRVEEDDLSSALLATMHEGGHALYDQGFRPGDRDTLLADGASSGMHEGQARLWENHIGRSRSFMHFLWPCLCELFPGVFDGSDPDRLWKNINVVRPGASRVHADEMSYHLHIALRYELERALLSRDFAVSELPHLWKQRSRELIGIEPASDREGVLQDVHWAVGMFGYYPTYTIGSLYAAQLVEAYRVNHDLDAEVGAGSFEPLRAWLATNVYEPGNRYSAEDIILKATGRGLDTQAFFAHITSPARAWSKNQTVWAN